MVWQKVLLYQHEFDLSYLKWGGVQLGDECTILSKSFFGSRDIFIGTKTFINYGCFIEGNVYIGNNCNIAYHVTFCTSSHLIGDCERRAGKKQSKKIVVGDGSWIGANTIIMPGVHIGKGVVIGAGSLVTKDCLDNCLYIGTPARLVKMLKDSNV